jgi:hypothetical protein
MNNYNYIIKILNLQDIDIKLEKIIFENNVYFIHLQQLKNTDITCPKCGVFEYL